MAVNQETANVAEAGTAQLSRLLLTDHRFAKTQSDCVAHAVLSSAFKG
jgi:hypothetical protein